MNARRPSYTSLVLAAGLALTFPGVAFAAPDRPAPTPSASAFGSSTAVPTATASATAARGTTAATAQRRIVVIQPSHPFDPAILRVTKPAGETATVTTAWGFQYRLTAGTTQVDVAVPCPPAGWVAGNPTTITYTPDGGQASRYQVVLREAAPSAEPGHRDRATVVQPDTRFDNAWVVIARAEAGGWFTIRTDYGFSQKYAGGEYGVFPPPAGGWVPGKSYRVGVNYASGRTDTVHVRLSSDAADPSLQGTLSGPDASGALTVQLTGVPVGEEVSVTVYTADMRQQIAATSSRAVSASPRYRLVGKDWREGQTYVVMATVGSGEPMGDYRWVQSFAYQKTGAKPAQKADSKPAQPNTKDRSGGLAKTGR